MHSIIKSSFYIIFLVLSIIVSTKLLLGSKGNVLRKILGITILFLGIGEGFHIVPRIFEIFTHDLEKFGSLIELGRFVSSITILFVYLYLYWFWKTYYKAEDNKVLELTLLILYFIGIALSIIFRDNTGYLLVLLRNVPVLIMGGIIIVLFRKQSNTETENGFKFLWIALLLSLVFTISFELLHIKIEFLTILMMPKTLMFIWFVVMVYLADKKGLLVK